MTSRPVSETGGRAPRHERLGYDGMEMALHWATALLVVTLYALSQVWSFLPRGTPVRLDMQEVHVSLGILLAAVVVTRIVDWYMDKRINIDDLITHVLPFEQINQGFDLMRRGESIRSVVVY